MRRLKQHRANWLQDRDPGLGVCASVGATLAQVNSTGEQQGEGILLADAQLPVLWAWNMGYLAFDVAHIGHMG